MSNAQEQKQNAAAVKQMVSTTGWQILEKELTDSANAKMTQLIEEFDPTKMKDLQCEIRAIRKLLYKIQMYLNIPT